MSIGTQNDARILPEYTVDNLGTSFKVVLVESVRCFINEKTGEEEISIPDFQGLMKKVAFARASHPLKLKSGDIKFLRKSLGIRSKDLALKLDVTPEHFSRCESGDKILSANSEKVLRMLVLLEPVYVLRKAAEECSKKTRQDIEELLKILTKAQDVISDMRITAAHDAQDELALHFKRVTRVAPEPANDETAQAPTEEWRDEEDLIAA